MEDEEYVPENSDLRYYLESLSLYDTHKDDTLKQKDDNLSLPTVTKQKPKSNAECIDKDIVEQIQELLSARMLFEEDVVNIERLLSYFKVVQVGMLRSIFENVSGFVVIVIGLCVYWAIGSYVFFMISIYYTYYAADYLWRKHFNQRQLKDLTNVLQANYGLFKKTLKFIKDSDEVLKLRVHNNTSIVEGFEVYFNLKEDFVQAENEIIKTLIKATEKLIVKFPFYDYIENPKHYLCNRFNQEFFQCMDANKLYQIYLLVQSEFLQRLALSLIPNIKISGSNNHLELYKIIKETSVILKGLESKFKKKFKYVYLRGIYDSESNINFCNSKKINSDFQSLYRNELISNIQFMSNTFQRLLIRSRTIESNLSNGEEPEQMENQLADIQNELNLCQRNLNDSIIVLKKFSYKKRNEIVNLNESIVDESVQENHKLPIDLSVEENMIEDEIFEAYFASENKTEEVEDDFDFEVFAKKKMEKEYSRLVLEELKTKIAEQAKLREKREASAIFKRIGEEESDDPLINSVNVKLSDSESTKDSEENISDNFFYPDKNICDNNVVSPAVNNEELTYTTFQVPTSNFLADIFKAREKLVQSPVNEEYFCNSENEDSD